MGQALVVALRIAMYDWVEKVLNIHANRERKGRGSKPKKLLASFLGTPAFDTDSDGSSNDNVGLVLV